MAPPQKKSKQASSSGTQPIDLSIRKWLVDPIAVQRWNNMKDFKIHSGSFLKFSDFASYRILGLARNSHIDGLLDFDMNNVEINHIMIKLFYANLNLQKYKPENSSHCLWSIVCGKEVFISCERMANILGSSLVGQNFDENFCNIHVRTPISHLFIEDDKESTKSMGLRPSARLLHHTIMRSLLPRVGNFDAVYKENFKALYAIYGDVRINWISMIFDEILAVNNSNRPHLFYNEYIMRLLLDCGVEPPKTSTISRPKVINNATIKRMKLPPPCLNIMPYEQWTRPRHSVESSQQPRSRPEEVKMIRSSSTTKESLRTISRNQFLLEARLKRMDSKIDRRFNKLKSFFGSIWEAISCASSTSMHAQDPSNRPAPPSFNWTSSDEATSSGTTHRRGKSPVEEDYIEEEGETDSEEEEDEEDDDDE